MDTTNISRNYLLGAILLTVVVLIVVTAVNPGSLIYKNTTDYEAQKKLAEQEAQQYQAMLDAVQPNYEASQQLLKKIASEDIVREEIENELQTKQKVVIPTVATADLKIAPRGDRAEMLDYVNRFNSMINNYNQTTQPVLSQTFADNADATVIASAVATTKNFADNIRGMEVPKDAVEMHKAYLVAYQTYGTFLDTAGNYAKGATSNPWPSVYGQYSIIDNRLATANTELNKLSQKYALNVPLPSDLASEPASVLNRFGLVKTANAQLGIGVSAVIDIKAAAELGIKAGLARAFAKFSIAMLDKLVSHIEKNYAIASQLYYSQDLGRYYSVEYMKKFVSDPLDQDIIQKFLPQYFCLDTKPEDLKNIFKAKAIANQGADIVLDPADPQFIQKLAKLGGDEKNYAAWWEDYYATLANQTQQEAAAAASKEVISPGLKSGRDLASGQINKTMSSIFNVQEAAISGTINLGNNNAENVVSQLVAGVVENLVNKFVFTPIGGGSASGGGIGIISETNVCLKTPQMKPVTSLPTSQIDNAPTESTIPSTAPFNPR